MTKVILKFEISLQGDVVDQKVLIPKEAQFLTVQTQRNNICMWFLCDPTAEKEEISFFICVTGLHIYNPPGYYLGSVQNAAQTIIFHVFSKTPLIRS